MDPEIKTQWLTALRSGEYQQGKYNLHKIMTKADVTEVTHCCLGVLCELLAKDSKITKGKPDKRSAECTAIGYLSNKRANINDLFYDRVPNFGTLDSDVANIAGLDLDEADNLAMMNDNGKSFAEIADYIETNL